MKNLSLKLRLIMSFLIIAAAVWSASGILAWHESREQIDEFFDTYQLMLARQLAAADWQNIRPDTQKSIDNIIDKMDDDGDEEDEAIGFAVFDKQGKMVFHDNENGEHFTYNPASGFINQPLGRKKDWWRMVWMESADGEYVIAIGQEMEYRNDVALEMVEETFVPWVCGLAVLFLAIIILISKEFRPLKKLAYDLTARKPDDLSPLSEECVPQEILPLVKAMNNLLKKIAEMLKRERSFIADSAHELRSPLTALKVQLDVAEMAEDDKPTQQKALKNLREGIERSSRLVEQLLALSKLESGNTYSEDEELNWGLIVGNAVEEQQPNAKLKNISIDAKIEKTTFLEKGQSFLWALLLRNLLDNAIRYSGKKADISIEINEKALTCRNNKVKIAKEHLARLGERFFRPAGQKTQGSGLGLSIVEKIAALHGCRVVYSATNDVFSVIITPK